MISKLPDQDFLFLFHVIFLDKNIHAFLHHKYFMILLMQREVVDGTEPIMQPNWEWIRYVTNQLVSSVNR